MTAYVAYILDLWAHHKIVDAGEMDDLRKRMEATEILLEAKQREAAELKVRSTSIEPIGNQSGKPAGRKAV